ncbi:MAG: AI-2E family transporter, partial [Deltaproteobacteria bacterium]|nr:AI-2E family transporter [Deltaproteobacteria bacterium]
MLAKSQALEKIFFWVLLGALALGFFWLLSPFFPVILFALVLALTFEPLYVFLLKIFRRRRHLSALICLLLIFLFLAVPLGGLVAVISNQLLKLAQTFQWDPALFKNLIGEGLITQTAEQWLAVLGIDV